MLHSTSIVVLFLLGAAFASALPGGLNQRIVGGKYAFKGQFPYQASLRWANDDLFCGAVIINEKWVLTAASCVPGPLIPSIRVVVGALQLRGDGTTHLIYDIIPHPGFNPVTHENDIALIKLVEPIKFSDSVSSIKLEKDFSNENKAGAQASGWGYTTYGGPKSSLLQWVELNILTLEECRQKHTAENARFVFNSTICTLSDVGTGMCYGDAGGPLTHNGKLQGIVSWAIPCAKGYPDVFMRVSSYYSWITEVTGLDFD
ncbi:chymotrypsin-1-like [Toxorhynchites rutilus septentrionalis]|uniref:chymotrypsin-1-like n=1 Tax=Toxorhynchites rutilus septentrionalis TaxID=329112 RepID=UPI00247A7A48|nr:chymotrypsin-1-like [Toxorhynchites rutilus septentrionalis]